MKNQVEELDICFQFLIVSPKNQCNYLKDFCPIIYLVLCNRTEILKIIAVLLERNNVFIKSFQILLTFTNFVCCFEDEMKLKDTFQDLSAFK